MEDYVWKIVRLHVAVRENDAPRVRALLASDGNRLLHPALSVELDDAWRMVQPAVRTQYPDHFLVRQLMCFVPLRV